MSGSTRPLTPLDRKVTVTVVPNSKPAEPKKSNVTEGRRWVLKNFTNEDILALLPHVKEALSPPKPASDAYVFFDKAKRNANTWR